ncbi:hypothetical protein VE25_10780 [Devosia geojensis]|uniref:DUF1772 domain-containing protein n=1 Tax=Devosia geojensis TaxID=443610 RepID=A0A0F5FTC8_9HYPH|nr:anthrone oxygenase family protein [Devosia geojensis]KKB11840.1 hypothetical protein VE25_10780 [Devosia geojensis]
MAFVLEVLAVLATAVVFSPALAHALEFPGKLRLERGDYLTVQRIYYPGFTAVGFLEPVSSLLVLALLFVLPAGGAAFWWALIAFVALVAMQAIYWLVTHPVNRVWLKEQQLSGAGEKFFSSGRQEKLEAGGEAWTGLRDRWEYSHIARAVLTGVALVSLTIVAAIP